MLVNNKSYRTIWLDEDLPEVICIIDQRLLPHEFVIEKIKYVDDMARAIKEMHVRGAGLIGAAAAWGMYLATLECSLEKDQERHLKVAANKLLNTRPTAVNLQWAIQLQMAAIASVESWEDKIEIARFTAQTVSDKDAESCREIGKYGSKLIANLSKDKSGERINILTHCNAGWLAFVDFGSATAPIYAAFEKGIDLHVWVDETRPRNQGARLTAWELGQQGIPHTVISDNVGGHLMQHGKVDLVIVGTDRTTYTGDVANKIGTYLKALAAKDNQVPFYVALPSSSFDWEIKDGVKNIPIEERTGEEVSHITGWSENGLTKVRLTPKDSITANYGFDVTPARLITGLITERGICKSSEDSIRSLFPEIKHK